MQSKQYDLSPLHIQYEVKAIVCQLRELRMDKGISQRQLADSIGVTKGTICTMENFINLPRLDLVIKCAGALGYEIELKLK